ncbi:DUF2341 domain-containing protein, partial [Patescibacteria group bacterium]|nr:DUF2341 domain-containing protein [Patescibacteria group bacterium]
IFALLSVAVGLIFLLKKPVKEISAAWFNDNWLYRKAVEITNSSGSALTDFQVSISIGTSAPIAAGKMQSDCDDIRITDINGKLLPHWLEENNPGCNTPTDTKIWTKAPSIPSSGGTLYIYYGNPGATNVASGDKVFEFFDDFNGSSLNTQKWQAWEADGVNTYNISSGRIQLTGGCNTGLITKSYSGTNYRIISRMIGQSDAGLLCRTSDGNHLYLVRTNVSGFATDYYLRNPGWTGLGGGYADFGSWANYRIVEFSANGNSLSSKVDGTQMNTITNNTFSSGGLGLRKCSGNASFDWVYAIKYAATDPTSSLSSTEEQSPGPVAYWKFDEGVGSTAYDSTANNNRGNLGAGNSAPSWQTEDMCVSGKCLKLDGGEDYVSAGTSSILNLTGSFTITTWIKRTKVTTDQEMIVSKDTVGSRGYALEIYKNKLSYEHNGGWVISDDAATKPDATISNNNWYFVAVKYDGSAFTTYVNGIQDATSTTTANPSTTADFRIGSRQYSGTEKYLTGFLDEVKIYPYARSAAQIKADYAARGSTKGVSALLGGGHDSSEVGGLSQGLVGYWKMDEASWNGTANEVVDSSGNGNHGQGVGTTPPTTAAGRFGNGGSFDGSEDYVSVSHSDTLDASNFTVSLWVKRTGAGTGSSQFFLLKNAMYGLLWNGSVLRYYDNTYHTSTIPLTQDQWYQITMVHSSQTVSLYSNGELNHSESAGSPSLSYNGVLEFGRMNPNYFQGTVDEVRIYNRALSPREVRDLYNWAPGPVLYWKFDEGSGTATNDSSSQGNSGTLTCSGTGCTIPEWTSRGKFGKALYFYEENPNRNYVSRNPINLPSTTGTKMTWATWLKPNSTQNGSGWFLRNGAGTDENYGLNLGSPSGGYYKVTFQGYDTTFRSISTTNYIVPAQEWSHVAVIYSQGEWMKIYVNGIFKEQVTWSYGNTVQATGSFVVGGNPGSTGQRFNGFIDDFHLYRYERSAKQIVEDMNAGHPIGGSPVGSQVGYWKFDEGYGTTTNNSGFGGLGLLGTLGAGNSAPSWTNDGKFGKALSFDGTNDYVQVPYNSSLNIPTELTVEFWFKAPSQAVKRMIQNGDLSGAWIINYYDSGAATTFGIYDGSWEWLPTTYNFTPNTWYHLVITYASNKLVSYYVNGKVHTSATFTKNLPTIDFPLTIGSEGATGFGTTYFNGLIDEVKIYNFALTEDEVKLDYNQGKGIVMGALSSGTGNTAPDTAASQEYCVPGDTAACSPPVAEWKMDEKNGSIAYDSTGTGNTGTLGTGDSAPAWVSGKIGGGLKFDGINDYVGVPSNTSLKPTSALSFGGWVKLNIVLSSQPASFPLIMDKYNLAGFSGYGILFNRGTDALFCRFGNGSALKDISISGAGSLLGTNWNHILCTFDGNIRKIYINGVEKASTTETFTQAQNDENLYLGTYDSTMHFFNGFIDQVRIYNYARTPAQIAWDYNRGGPVGWWKLDECEGVVAHDSAAPSNDGAINIGATAPQTTAGSCGVGNTAAAWYNGRNGKYNSSLNFDGADDYVTVGDSDDIQPTSAVTIGAWVKADASHVGVIAEQGSDANSEGFGIFNCGTSFALYAGGNSGGLNEYHKVTSTTFAAGEWYYVVGTYTTAASPYGKIYVDGVEQPVTTGGDCNVPGSKNGGNALEYAGTSVLNIGSRNQGTSTFFDGQIDDVRIYNYALTPLQIRQLYNENSSVRFGPLETN